jgi:hypothetical protein
MFAGNDPQAGSLLPDPAVFLMNAPVGTGLPPVDYGYISANGS